MGRFTNDERSLIALVRRRLGEVPLDAEQRRLALKDLFALRRRVSFSSRRRVFAVVLPDLRARLDGHRWLARADELQATLRLVLDALPEAAWVVSRSGRTLFRNAKAGEQPAPPRDDRSSGRYERRPVDPLTELVLERPRVADVHSRLALAARSWGLSPREQQALGYLIEGASNKAIAAGLNCAVRTAEVHVARILKQAGVKNRTALLAAFWSHSEPVTAILATTPP